VELLFVSFQAPVFMGKGINYKLGWILNQLENELDKKNFFEDVDLSFIVLPEYFLGRKPRTYEEIKSSQNYGRLKDWSKEHDNVVIVPGSAAIYKKDKILNQAPVVFEGKLLGLITKNHPFGREIEYGVLPSEEIFYTTIKKVRLGGVICADLWYPNLFDRKKRPLDVILVPIQAVVPSRDLIDYGRFLWQSLTVTRSKEQVAVVVSADLAPTKLYSDTDWYTSGASYIIDPTFRFTNQNEFHQGIKNCKKKSDFCYMKISLEKIHEYKEYRRKMFYNYS